MKHVKYALRAVGKATPGLDFTKVTDDPEVLACLQASTASYDTNQCEMDRFFHAQLARDTHARLANLHEMAQASGCPPEESALVIGGQLRQTTVLERVRREVGRGWARAERPPAGAKHWLVLCGLPGTGKSLAAVWALLRGTWDAEGNPISGLRSRMFITSKAVAELNPKFGPDRAKLADLTAVKWLVLDDVGYLDAGDGNCLADSVQRLLTDRHEKRARTIITTNLSTRQLLGYEHGATGERVPGYAGGDRMSDRLNQLATFIITKDESLRSPTTKETSR